MALKDRLGGLGKLPRHVRIWLLGIPIIIVACLIYFLVVKPKARDIEKMRRDISQVQSMVRTERQLLATFTPLSKEEQGLLKVTKRSIASVEEAQGSINQIHSRLTQRARSCNISDPSIDPNYRPSKKEGEEEKKPPVYADIMKSDTALVKVSFHSDLRALGCYLSGIDSEVDTLIESLTITRRLPKPDIEIVFTVFAKK